MRVPSSLRTIIGGATIALMSGSALGQVFIPTTLERDWLNEQIPGIVDGSGIMDTLHPGISGLDTAMIHFPTTVIPSIQLYGLQHLNSLIVFSIDLSLTTQTPVAIMTTGIPVSLRSLSLDVGDANISLPEFPSEMDRITIRGDGPNEIERTLQISGMPETVTTLEISGFDVLEWNGMPTVTNMYLDTGIPSTSHDQPYVVPPAITGSLTVGDHNVFFEEAIDLTQITCSDVLFRPFICELVEWPTGMEVVRIDCDGIGMVGQFGPGLREVHVDSFEPICLPWLPETVEVLELTSGVECLPNWPSLLTFESLFSQWSTYTEVNFCSVLNSDCPGSYPGISGVVFIDLDGNGEYDPGETPLPQSSVVIQPGNNAAGCDPNGYWEVGVFPGSYTITPSSYYPYVQSYSPAQHTADVPNMGDADTLNDFAVTLMPDIEDLRASIHAGVTRPGFNNRLYLRCDNYGTVPMDATLTLQFDADQTWVGSSIPPASQSGNTATWNFAGMPIGAVEQFTVDLNTPASVPLGTSIVHTLTADPLSGDETPDNNVVQFTDSVLGSYDPNDKQVQPDVLPPAVVQAGSTRLEYLIRFQNTGTYPADRVLILDTLPEGLQVESIQWLGSSHPCHWYVVDGVLHAMHADINLPDSTSDEPNSHGFVRFSILPATDLINGDQVMNIAHIVFDFNEPIITPPAVFRVDVLAGVDEQRSEPIRVLPNPAHETIRITGVNGTFAYAIRDMSGRTVLRGTSNGSIDLSSIANGLYQLEATGNDRVFTARFVRQ
ncbi:MAG: T9SS type A sorting domain-containing protein [Flavobacteriales bacterium]